MTFQTLTVPQQLMPRLISKILMSFTAPETGGMRADSAFAKAVIDAREDLLCTARRDLSGARRKVLEIAATDVAGC